MHGVVVGFRTVIQDVGQEGDGTACRKVLIILWKMLKLWCVVRFGIFWETCVNAFVGGPNSDGFLNYIK
jgi:hypothetical protein